jgi:hypothetical protein
VHLKYNLEEQIKTDYDPYSIKKEDFTEDSIDLRVLYEKFTKLMENKDFKSSWKISKLKFESYSLRSPFYKNIKDLYLGNSSEVSSTTISSLRNQIGEKIHDTMNNKPNSITWEDFTPHGLNFKSIYNKLKLSIENHDIEKRDTITKLFPPRSSISQAFYAKIQTLKLTNTTDLNKCY